MSGPRTPHQSDVGSERGRMYISYYHGLVWGSAHVRGPGIRSREGSGGPLTLFVDRSDVP